MEIAIECAQVALNARIGRILELLRRKVSDEFAAFEQSDSGAEHQALAQIVGDEDDGFLQAILQGAKFALQFIASDRIESAEGLVHQQNRRIGGKGAGHADPLALAA